MKKILFFDIEGRGISNYCPNLATILNTKIPNYIYHGNDNHKISIGDCFIIKNNTDIVFAIICYNDFRLLYPCCSLHTIINAFLNIYCDYGETVQLFAHHSYNFLMNEMNTKLYLKYIESFLKGISFEYNIKLN